MFSYLTLRVKLIRFVDGQAGCRWVSHATVEVFVVEQGAMMCKGRGLA